MDDLERWYQKNNQPGDLYVMESCNNSFETSERLRDAGGHVVVLESFSVGQIHTACLKNDKFDARKVARPSAVFWCWMRSEDVVYVQN
jgi:hypothetical protein